MAIIKNKKGIFFTFTAIIIISALMIAFSPKKEISFDKDITVVKTRVAKIDNFISDFENVYLKDIVQSTSYSTLTSLTYYMDATDSFLVDLRPAFKEVLLYGTINNEPIDDVTGEMLMTNNSILHWINKTKETAESALNINMSYSIVDARIYQKTPWFVDINMTISYSISSETANWTKNNVLVQTKLSIDKLYDPLYYVNTDGTYIKKINQTDIKFDEWNAMNLTHFIDKEEYVHWQNSNAPDFLMRFTNAFSSSECCGIESAVNPKMLNPPLDNQEKIYLDYLFFNPANGPYPCVSGSRDVALYKITGINEPRFKLDFSNVEKYNVTEDAAEILC